MIGVTPQATHDPVPAKGEDVAEKDLGAQNHQAGLDEQLRAHRGFQPGGNSQQIAPGQSDQKRPQGVTESVSRQGSVPGHQKTERGQAEQDREAGGETTGLPLGGAHGQDGQPSKPDHQKQQGRPGHRRRDFSQCRPPGNPGNRRNHSQKYRPQHQQSDPDGPPVLQGSQCFPVSHGDHSILGLGP